MVTTEYVVDELLTLLKIRGEFPRALHLGQRLLMEEIIDMAWVTPGDVQQARDVHRQNQDKAWSITDCVSLVIMERLGIRTAFAFDKHFRQFDTVNVVP